MNQPQPEFCALCGLPVEIDGFSLQTAQGLQLFCCAGCLCMYELINDNQLKQNETTTLENN